MTIPYSFANASGTLPLIELDANFESVYQYVLTAGNVVNNAQANITSVGLLNSVSVSGNVSAAGNITGAYYFGNGVFLTGMYGNSNVANYLPVNPTILTIENGLVAVNANVANTNANVAALSNTVANISATTGNIDASLANTNANVANTNSNVANLVISLANTNSNVANTDSNLANTNSNVANTNSNVANLTTSLANTNSNVANLTSSLANTNANVANVYTSLTGVNSVLGNAVANITTLQGQVYANSNVTAFFANATIGITTTGNIAANYFIGDGSQLTNINANNITNGYSNTNVINLLSNFGNNVISTSGNITAGIFNGGLQFNANSISSTSNTLNLTANEVVISHNLQVLGTTTTVNVANVNVSNAVVVVSEGALSPSQANSSGIQVAANNYASFVWTNITNTWLATGNLSVAGNVAGNVFIGDGSGLTNINAGNITGAYSNANVANYLPTYTGNLSISHLSVANDAVIYGNLSVAGNITYQDSNAISTDNLFAQLANNTANISEVNGAGLVVGQGNLVTFTYSVPGNEWTTNVGLSVTGSVAGNVFIGNGSGLTNINASNIVGAYGNANVEAYLPTSNVIIAINSNVANTDSNVANISNAVTSLSGNVYANANVEAYLPASNVIISINSNVANISNAVTSLSGNVYANANVEAYLPASNVIISINSNIANTNSNVANISNAVTSLSGNVYANANVEAYLPTSNTIIAINSNIANTNGNVANNASNITTLQGNVITLTNDLANTNSNIANTNGNVANNASNITTLQGNVITLTNDLANTNSNVANISNAVTSLSGNVYANANVVVLMADFGNNSISTTGNITGGYLLGNGAFISGLPAGYSNADAANYFASGNSSSNISITGNVLTTGNVSATGNVYASSLYGDGYNISNINAGNIVGSYGNSNVEAYLPTSNVIISINSNIANTNGNVANISNAVTSLSGNVYANANVEAYLPSSNVIIAINSNVANTNSNVANISNAVTSLSGNVYANANVAAYLPTYTGNLTGADLSISNNAIIYGNLSVAGNITYQDSNAISTDNLFVQLANNTANIGEVNGAGLVVGQGNLVTFVYSVPGNAWHSDVGFSAAGNVSGNVFIGDGSGLSNINAGNIVGSYGNSNVEAYLPSSNIIIGINSNVANTNSNVSNNASNITTLQGNVTSLFGLVYNNTNVSNFMANFGSNSISTTGNISAGNLLVSSKGAIGVAPQQEIHVARNGSDADGNGSITNPYRTITYALAQTGSGSVMVVHPGSYTEDVAINNLSAISITAAQPGAASPQSYVINGNVTVSGNAGSILLHSIGVVGSITHSSSGSFFVTAIQMGTSDNSTTFNKTGTGYLEVTNGNWSGGTPAVTVTGAGLATFNGVQLTNLTVNNANASVILRNVPSAVNTTLTSGTLTVISSTMIGNSNTAPAITTVAGTLNIQNSILLRANNTAGIMSVGAATAYLYDDMFFDRTNSTLSGIPISGTAFAPPAEFQAIRADSMSVSGNNIATGNVTGGNIRTAGQVSATGNVTGNYILGNGSQLTSLPAPTVTPDISSTGDMSIMTYDGVIKSVNYATVEPSSGNIKGGNITTTGLVSATGNITAGNVNSPTLNNSGNISVVASGNTWTFGTDGNLTFPTGNLVITPDDPAGNIASIVSTDHPLVILSSGANGAVASLWVEDYANVGTSNIAAVYANPTSGSKIVRIAVGQNGIPGPNLWDFGTDGNLTLPRGGIVYETNIPFGGFNGNTIALKPSGGTNADQQLLIYPTANTIDANHLHLTSGNLYNTELFLGDDNLYVKLANTGNVVINSNDNAGNTAQWIFDATGNLTLPGNTSSINYANGQPYGNGGTGNVTFSDQIVIGTGGNDGSGGLYLAPGNASIANSAVQYLRVRGGDVATHIHLDTGNSQYFDQYFGNDNKYVKLAAGGNVVIGSDNAVGNAAQWTFDTAGVLTVPGGGGVWSIGAGTVAMAANIVSGNAYLGLDDTSSVATLYGNVGVQIVANATVSWNFNAAGNLTLPVIVTGTGLTEETVIQSQRKIIPPFRWSAVISGITPTVVYTATNAQTTSMKVTIQVQHTGLGMELFDISATYTGADTYYTVSNRVAPPTITESTVVVDLNGSNIMQITVTVNSGAATSWVTYDAVEFGIPND